MVYGIALGSNLGDRLQHLREAVHLLQMLHPSMRLLSAAPVYETEPVDCPEGSKSFYNSVVEIECALPPLDLLRALQGIEEKLGRPNVHAHHAPRTVDLDMLYAGQMMLAHPDLTLPHPRLTQRRFVIQPLADIRPELILPGDTQTILQHLGALPPDEPSPRSVASAWTDSAPVRTS